MDQPVVSENNEDSGNLDRYFAFSPYFADVDLEEEAARNAFLFRFGNLPPELRSFIVAPETADYIFSLMRTQAMTEQQVRALARVLRYFLAGAIYIKDLPQAVAGRLGIDNARAGSLIDLILTGPLAPFLEIIKKTQRQNFSDRLAQEASPGRTAPATAPAVPQPPMTQPSASPIANQNNVLDLRNQKQN